MQKDGRPGHAALTPGAQAKNDGKSRQFSSQIDANDSFLPKVGPWYTSVGWPAGHRWNGVSPGSFDLVRSMSRMDSLILIVDDERSSRDLVRAELEECGYRTLGARDGDEAWRLFQEQRFDLVISDLRMPRSDGMTLLRRIRSPSSPQPHVPVILVSAYGTLSTAALAGRCGATDFFPLDEHGLDALTERARQILQTIRSDLPDVLLGNSSAVREVRRRLSAVAPLRSPVLVYGAAHTGQEAAIAYIHQHSGEASQRLLRVTCARDHVDVRARPGTIHLQDVDRLPLSSQRRVADLLSAWERGLQQPLRILASTQTDLMALADEGGFDPFLAESLARFAIRLPTLEERSEDLPELVEAFLTRVGRRLGRLPCEFDRDALDRLRQHTWPGNFKELEIALETVMAFSGPGPAREEDVAAALSQRPTQLERIDARRRQQERERLIVLYQKHGTYSGVARELGITRNAAKYRFAKYDLIPRSTRRSS